MYYISQSVDSKIFDEDSFPGVEIEKDLIFKWFSYNDMLNENIQPSSILKKMLKEFKNKKETTIITRIKKKVK